MNTKMIVMLTYNDKTVKNALELFEECKNIPIEYLGFKNILLPNV